MILGIGASSKGDVWTTIVAGLNEERLKRLAARVSRIAVMVMISCQVTG